MSVAIVPQEAPLTLSPFEPQAIQHAMALAQELSKSGLVPAAVRGKPADILVIMLTARELGIGPMQGLSDINVIQGKPVFSADLMVAQCKRRSDVCKYIRVVETNATKAVYETQRAGSPEPERYTFTIEDARKLGIADKDNYKKQPATMLRRRAAAALAREVYPDLVRGYDPDEAEDFAPVETKPAATTVVESTVMAVGPAMTSTVPPPETKSTAPAPNPRKIVPLYVDALYRKCMAEMKGNRELAREKWNACAFEALGDPNDKDEKFPDSSTWTPEQTKAVEEVMFPKDIPF